MKRPWLTNVFKIAFAWVNEVNHLNNLFIPINLQISSGNLRL
jgi:hypothetical protein